MRTGHDIDYYSDAVGKAPQRGLDEYYTGAVAAGEPAGRWFGRGADRLGLAGEVDAEVIKAVFTHRLDPRDPNVASRETWHQAARYGSPPRNYRKADEIYAGLLDKHPDAGPEERAELRGQAARSARESVSFYDVVLSAPKSLTLLWVACERGAHDADQNGDTAGAEQWRQVAATIEDSLMVGHRAVLSFLESNATFARAGHHGGGAGKWLDGSGGLIAAQWLQHDSREHDPQLHVHGTVANMVECDDGKVRALDFTLFTQWHDAAAAYGERVAEAYAAQQIGLSWQTRADGKAREVAGVEIAESILFSKRTSAITPALEAKIAQFRAETGRDPSKRERTGLAEQASVVTKQSKVFGGETRDGQLSRWAAEYDAHFGRTMTHIATTALAAGEQATAALWSERDVISRALGEMEESRQSWTRSNLMLAISNALPGDLGVDTEQIEGLLEGLTDRAQILAQHLNPRTGPEGLDPQYYRADGESVFVKPHAQRYATANQLLGEEELRAAAVRRGAPTWTSEQVDQVMDVLARGGRVLGVDQAAALRGILTSGAAVEVLNAPAGTGKSFLVGTLADTWPLTGQGLPDPSPSPGDTTPNPDPTPDPGPSEQPVGEGLRVFGIAAGQRQTDILAEEGVTARNIRRWLDTQHRLADDRPVGDDHRFRLRAGDLLVVDEAGTASTPDLVAIHRFCELAGAKLLLVGDHKQLVAVGAGGALADITDRGIAYDLAEVRRFHQPWEATASLRLRDGDQGVVDEYAKHGRLIDGGTPEQAEAAAARAWLAATLDGKEALLTVGSNAAAARTSNQLRAELVRLGQVADEGVPLGMPGWEGSIAGVGDLVQARRNAWHLDGWCGNTEAPINRTVYRVTGLRAGGGLSVARVTGRDEDGAEQLADPIQLPGSYVGEQVTLAYASTAHAALGRTVGVGLGVPAPGTDAGAAYVMSTRGRDTNLLFMVTRNVADSAATGETHKVAQRSPAEILADIIRPPDLDRNRTALTEAEVAAEQARSTSAHLDPMLAVIEESTPGRVEGWLDQLAATGALPEHHRIGFAADEARTSVEQLLRTAELAGHDPAQILSDAVTTTSLDGAASVAQVLHFRIRAALKDQLAPQVSSFADLLPRHLTEQTRAGLEALADAADTRRAELGALTALDPPQWAREALGPAPDVADDPDGRARWEERAGWAAAYRELADHTAEQDPLGAAPPAGLPETHALFRTAHAALDLPTFGAEEETMSEGRLRARIAAWEHELRWAPRYVADELEATHDALRTARDDATLWAARAEVETDPKTREELRSAAEHAAAQVETLAEQVRDLEFADEARDLWRMDSIVTRDNAERARVAAGWRGIDLDHPGEHVTTQDWLDAQAADHAASDAERIVTEVDLSTDETTRDIAPPDQGEDLQNHGPLEVETHWERADPDHDRLESRDPRLVENVPPVDLRQVSEPDPRERTDPEQRRRVPPRDETTAAVTRARVAFNEVADRRSAEQASLVEHDPVERVDDDDLYRSHPPVDDADAGRDEDSLAR
ncbi:MobF family relaxase [Pseudonocardia sp. GCM10023141]|uniref:MobF family relaxase n=1 Tax=Pseudonocardia sp. GCM10023141 TaxID=3252653 RepID=UPI00360DEAEB